MTQLGWIQGKSLFGPGACKVGPDFAVAFFVGVFFVVAFFAGVFVADAFFTTGFFALVVLAVFFVTVFFVTVCRAPCFWATTFFVEVLIGDDLPPAWGGSVADCGTWPPPGSGGGGDAADGDAGGAPSELDRLADFRADLRANGPLSIRFTKPRMRLTNEIKTEMKETAKDHSRNQSGEPCRLEAPLRVDDAAMSTADGGASRTET